MSERESSETVTLTASCLCKANSFTTSIPSASLPLQSSTCHCTSCRHVTGALYTHDAVWPGPLRPVTEASTLSRYQMTKNVTLLFCRTCSSPMFWWERHAGQEEVLDVLIGVLECDYQGQVVKETLNKFVGDTVDGGAAPWLTGEEGRPCWYGQSNKSELLGSDWPPFQDIEGNEDRGPDEVPITCHCGGVSLTLRRGDADYAKMKRENLPFFVHPETHRLLASFDACTSCRKSFGANVINWTFTLLNHIAFPDDKGKGSTFPTSTVELKDAVAKTSRDERFGTLAFYRSSPDVQRYFCSRCSASVLYAVDDRPDMVDLAVGLLHDPQGARAEGRLAWALGPPVTWKGDVKGTWREGYVADVERAAEGFRSKTGRAGIWKRADRERGGGGD